MFLFVSPLVVDCDIQESKGHLVDVVNPYSFVVAFRPLCLVSDDQCSDVFEPVVVTVDGNVESMFFGNVVHLAAVVKNSSKDGRCVESLCKCFGIAFESKYLGLDHEPLSNDLGLNHDLVPADDPAEALYKCDRVPREDFDCSEASLESEGEFDISQELSP